MVGYNIPSGDQHPVKSIGAKMESFFVQRKPGFVGRIRYNCKGDQVNFQKYCRLKEGGEGALEAYWGWG